MLGFRQVSLERTSGFRADSWERMLVFRNVNFERNLGFSLESYLLDFFYSQFVCF